MSKIIAVVCKAIVDTLQEHVKVIYYNGIYGRVAKALLFRTTQLVQGIFCCPNPFAKQ